MQTQWMMGMDRDGHGNCWLHRGSNCAEACSSWCVGWSLLARIPAEVALGSARAWLSAPVPDNLMDGGFNLEAAQRLSPDVGRCRYKELSNMERREMGLFVRVCRLPDSWILQSPNIITTPIKILRKVSIKKKILRKVHLVLCYFNLAHKTCQHKDMALSPVSYLLSH